MRIYLKRPTLEEVESWGLPDGKFSEECFFCCQFYTGRALDAHVYTVKENGEEWLAGCCALCASLPDEARHQLLRAQGGALEGAYSELAWMITTLINGENESGRGDKAEALKWVEFKVEEIGARSETLLSYQVKDSSSVVIPLGYVYLLGSPHGYCKIGHAKALSPRLAQIGLQLPFKVELLHSVYVPDARKVESWFHRLFADCRANGEWFNLSAEQIQWVCAQTSASVQELIRAGIQQWQEADAQ